MPIFVSIFICFSGAAKAQSRQDVGTAEAVKPLQIGDTIPEELWNMPLQVVNHPDGKDTITLNDYRHRPYILLDFWSRHCGPCIRTLDAFQQLANSMGEDLTIITVYVDNPANLASYMFGREWLMPAVINKESEILNNSFFNRKQYGGLVLILDGIFYASPNNKNLNAQVFGRLENGESIRFVTKYPHLLHGAKGEQK